MGFYIFILLFVLGLFFITKSTKDSSVIRVIAFIVLWLSAGTIVNFSIDYIAYVNIYNDSLIYGGNLELIWLWLIQWMRSLNLSHTFFFIVTQFTVNLLFFYVFKKYSTDFWLSVVLFIACGFYFEALNGIRQYIAIAIILPAIFRLIEKGKVCSYFFWVIFAAQFHGSAYIMLLLPLIYRIQVSIPLLYLTLFATCLIGTYIAEGLIYIAKTFLSFGKYDVYFDMNFNTGVTTGLKKYFLNIVGIIILYMASKTECIKNKDRVLINMLILGIVVYNIFQYYLVPLRFGWYMDIAILFVIPQLFKAKLRSYKIIMLFIIILGYAILYSKGLYERAPEYSFDFNLR